ncbi:UPF0182 family protein [Candidatus Blastococcus massiliensis]|uniref:UPF0182 family protein n=1 Tax=Candidatus Blastococcus massiliensis TaxID=1470358 RepID=UPI0004B3228D|nr:UPF0182 family protein [Candidatus Blastococcus massiliensis]
MTNVYVNYLWFDETGYTEVFWTELEARALLFGVAGVGTGGLVALSIYLAYRFRPTFRPMSPEQQNLERYRQSLEPRRGLVLTAVAVVLGLFAGGTAHGNWETWLQFRHSADFGQVDPQFGVDTSFFVFDYLLPAAAGLRVRDRAAGADRLTAHALRVRWPAGADAGAEAHRRRPGVAVGTARPVRAAQGSGLLAGPLRAGVLRPR